ncbi:tripartite tricarboxylate transporter substrate binding protein [Variovorax ginsengisoli]|uniref:Tripartite tricarboxylate transporter substrate binding protein n=1 Tax=Variovorax ginsengisoli TaxID=363844 RepID=A0ABT8S502_9BURK|nr:tripartite tricarboxylate transporter substrate binding protein [Variovorax ginsengisoli]MDN8614398.1 tripartite tricarboxylate transporter substrate binding protein [Variovorax ginsengisoli]MDO1533568.1 tripartite tricarboxylate transporter substrate binding protein [Variovorax ginsengisoli]
MNRRKTLFLLGAGAAALTAPWAQAQTVTRLLVGATPGGGTDIVARELALELSRRLGRQFIVDNRPGAAGNIAAQAVAKSPPDGGTLLLSYTSHAINPSLYGKLPFDAVADFTPLAGIASLPGILVARPDLPANDIKELIALAKSKPGKLNIAIAGLGSSNHLASEVLKLDAGINITGVPYKGTGPALQDVLAGQIDLVISGVASVQQLLRAGKVKALGVTSKRRLADFPEVPAIAEAVPGFDFSSWYGLFGPAGMQPAEAARISAAAREALGSPAMRERFKSEGLIAMGTGQEEFGRFVKSEIVRWGKIVQATGAKPE